MRKRPCSPLLACLLAAAWLLLPQFLLDDGQPGSGSARAGEEKADAKSAEKTAQESAAAFLAGIQKQEELVRRLSPQAVPNIPPEQRPVVLGIESATLGSSYIHTPQGAQRFFAAEISLLNRTDKPLELLRASVSLTLDGVDRPFQEVPQQVRYQFAPLGRENQQIDRLIKEPGITVPPGHVGRLWVVFAEIPTAGDVPSLQLQIPLGEAKYTLDVNAWEAARLGLEQERIGPNDALALLTIHGELNAINAGTLAGELDKAVAAGLARAVVRFAQSDKPPHSQITNWLKQSVGFRQNQAANPQFPELPAQLRELHLASLPGEEGPVQKRGRRTQAQRTVHETDVDAVTAALQTAYRILPHEQLLACIQEGHPLARSAALAAGGSRLAVDDLPVVLAYAHGDDPLMRRAALQALQHFGDPQAVETLTQLANSNNPNVAEQAVVSLANSRFGLAHAGLQKMFDEASPGAQKRLAVILAEHPRGTWADVLFQFAHHDDPEVRLAATEALIQIGHPRLPQVLEQALASDVESLRTQALVTLINQGDAESERIAMQFTLAYLHDKPPLPPMFGLLTRTKDRQAVPLLLKQFDESGPQRQGMISLLGQIGDQSVFDFLVDRYPGLSNAEKSSVLHVLLQVDSSQFRKLAADALQSEDGGLANAACRGLMEEGSPAGIRLLVDARDETSRNHTRAYAADALATLGDPASRDALQKARLSEDQQRRSLAISAVRRLRQRSPGFGFTSQGQKLAGEEKWAEALEQFELSIEADPELPEAFTGKGNVLLKTEKFTEARLAYAKAGELDPYDPQAVTGLGVALAVTGDVQQAVKQITAVSKYFQKDALFAYNSACVYGRAVDYLDNHPEAAEREKSLPEYRQAGLDQLRSAIKLGFSDLEWMDKDPDLESLRKLPEFEQIRNQPATNEAKG